MTTRAIPARPFAGVQKTRRQARVNDVPPDVREAVWGRCGGLCEACKEPLSPGWHAHHRLRRSQGGDNSVTNVLALHSQCHVGVHRYPVRSYEAGFLVKMGQQPGRIRLALHWSKWVRLARDASYVEAA